MQSWNFLCPSTLLFTIGLCAIPGYKPDARGEASPIHEKQPVTPNPSLLQRLTMETIPPILHRSQPLLVAVLIEHALGVLLLPLQLGSVGRQLPHSLAVELNLPSEGFIQAHQLIHALEGL